MTNEEKAVIEAARAIAQRAASTGLALELRDAVAALDAATPKPRNFLISFSLVGPRGAAEGDIFASCIGLVTQATVTDWRAGISARNDDASIVIRTWTELEG